MAANVEILRRPSDRALAAAVAIGFPLIVLVGYAKTYYLKTFFDGPALANSLVHLHGMVMSAWVLYFVAQVALVRTRNVRLHMTLGFVGIALAALVVIVGFATGYDSNIVRRSAPPGADPHEFFIVPITDMVLFVILFSAAIYYRKKPAKHKALMILTAVNFIPAALARMPLVPPDQVILFAFAGANGIGIALLLWNWRAHGKLNWTFAFGLAMLMLSLPARIWFASTPAWHQFTNWLAG